MGSAPKLWRSITIKYEFLVLVLKIKKLKYLHFYQTFALPEFKKETNSFTVITPEFVSFGTNLGASNVSCFRLVIMNSQKMTTTRNYAIET